MIVSEDWIELEEQRLKSLDIFDRRESPEAILLTSQEDERFRSVLSTSHGPDVVGTPEREGKFLDHVEDFVSQFCPLSQVVFRDRSIGIFVYHDARGPAEEQLSDDIRESEEKRPVSIFFDSHCDTVVRRYHVRSTIVSDGDGFELFHSSYLDNRVSCASLLMLLQLASSERFVGKLPSFMCFFAVQEEIGKLGAKRFLEDDSCLIHHQFEIHSIYVLDVSPGWFASSHLECDALCQQWSDWVFSQTDGKRRQLLVSEEDAELIDDVAFFRSMGVSLRTRFLVKLIREYKMDRGDVLTQILRSRPWEGYDDLSKLFPHFGEVAYRQAKQSLTVLEDGDDDLDLSSLPVPSHVHRILKRHPKYRPIQKDPIAVLGNGVVQWDQEPPGADRLRFWGMTDGSEYSEFERYRVPLNYLSVPIVGMHCGDSFCCYGDCRRLVEVLLEVLS